MNNDRDRPLSGSDEDATLARLQRVALQLIRNRGYEATTLDDVAEALQVPAGVVSQHFATMEALVLYDTLAPPTIDAVHALLPDASPATALRVALHQVLDHLSVDEIDDLRYRVALIAAKPAAARDCHDERPGDPPRYGRTDGWSGSSVWGERDGA